MALQNHHHDSWLGQILCKYGYMHNFKSLKYFILYLYFILFSPKFSLLKLDDALIN